MNKYPFTTKFIMENLREISLEKAARTSVDLVEEARESDSLADLGNLILGYSYFPSYMDPGTSEYIDRLLDNIRDTQVDRELYNALVKDEVKMPFALED